MKYKVIYFLSSSGDNPVKSFIYSLNEIQQLKIMRIIQILTEYGLQAIIHHIKKLKGTPFWEIRILGKDNIRIIYIIPFENNILLLNGFLKKAQKTPSKEINICYQRYEEFKKSLTR